MRTQRKSRPQKSLLAKAVLTGWMLLVVIPVSTSVAHEWTIENRKVNASVKKFDGETVTFELENRKLKSVPVQQLNTTDLNYLKTLMELNRMTRERGRSSRDQAVQFAQLQVMLEQYRSQWYELWVVQLVAPNGQYFYWTYPVRNSYQATSKAQYQFPGATILWVKKLRRQY